MDISYPSKLHVWDGATVGYDYFGLTGLGGTDEPPAPAQPPHDPSMVAEQLFASEALDPVAVCPRREEGTEPYSLQWFLSVESQRHGRQGKWIPRLLEFARHNGETLLGLGSGLGTDWLQYARHGASVVVCSPSGPQLSLIRRNFELRGLTGRFVHAPPETLPLESSSIDVACINNMLHLVRDAHAVLDEVYRVLKPGGKILAVTRARYDVDYWYDHVCWWRLLLRGRGERYPGLRGRQLKRLLGRFAEHRLHKRQLRRREVPSLWRLLPLPLLERMMGRVLVIKAFKPLSAALPARAAA
jgi:SAM-dependent methyltransferase